MHPIFKYLGFVYCLSLSHIAIAQDSTMRYPANQIKFNPVKLIDLVNTGLEFGYERRIANRFATHVSAAVLVNYLNINSYHSYSGYRFIAEQKYIITNPYEDFWIYPSISFVYNNMNFSTVDAFTDINQYNATTPNYYNGYLDSFMVTKHTYSVNACLGIVLPLYRNRLLLDMSGGIGIKYRDVTHSQRINPNDKMALPRHPNVYYISNKEGQYYTPNMLLTFRIAYSF